MQLSLAEEHIEPKAGQKEDEPKLHQSISVMQPVLRFLQLLCENHNQALQNFLRSQSNKHNYNLVRL